MVARGEDRLHVRLSQVLVVSVGALVGLLLPFGAFGSDTGRLLTTFLGFFTAGVLPTISILIGSVSAAGRSVKALNAVHNETRSAISALVGLLKLAGASVAALILLSLALPPMPLAIAPALATSAAMQHLVPVDTSSGMPLIDFGDIIRRLGQALVCTLTLLFIQRASKLPSFLYGALRSKHELAIDEARRKLEEKAPTSSDISKAFSAAPEFGAVIRFEEMS